MTTAASAAATTIPTSGSGPRMAPYTSTVGMILYLCRAHVL